MAECLASVFALTVLIVTWDLVAWMVRDCWKTRGVRIPLVLAVATGWWAFGILTVSFSEMEDPRTGETTKIGPGMLSPLPFIPLTNISREMEEQWDGGKNFTGWMTKMILAVYLPMGLAGAILLLGVPLGWAAIAARRVEGIPWVRDGLERIKALL